MGVQDDAHGAELPRRPRVGGARLQRHGAGPRARGVRAHARHQADAQVPQEPRALEQGRADGARALPHQEGSQGLLHDAGADARGCRVHHRAQHPLLDRALAGPVPGRRCGHLAPAPEQGAADRRRQLHVAGGLLQGAPRPRLHAQQGPHAHREADHRDEVRLRRALRERPLAQPPDHLRGRLQVLQGAVHGPGPVPLHGLQARRRAQPAADGPRWRPQPLRVVRSKTVTNTTQTHGRTAGCTAPPPHTPLLFRVWCRGNWQVDDDPVRSLPSQRCEYDSLCSLSRCSLCVFEL